MPGGAAVADVAFRREKAWIESQRTSGPGHQKLSANVSTPWPTNLSFSAASRLTAVESCCQNGALTLEIVGPPGSHPKVLDSWSNNADSEMAAWSPNGRLIAYLPGGAPPSTQTTGPLTQGWPITVIAPNGRRRRVLTPGLSDHNVRPVFSPDGRSILFCANAPGAGLYTVPISGGPTHRIIRGDCVEDLLAWSPTGRQIAYIRPTDHGLNPCLFVINVRTGRVRKLAGPVQDNGALAWSPNGKEIAFAGPSAVAGSAAVETINANGTGIRDLVHIRGYSATFDLAWSPSSRQIAFTAGPGPEGY
jgi:Tol biopolymer transport system component